LTRAWCRYETSLDSFLGVFVTALDQAKRDASLNVRLDNMTASVTRNVYDYTCTGIFERHKLMFSFQMACMVLDGEGRLQRQELGFFLKGDTSLAGEYNSHLYHLGQCPMRV
jgi:dynein heavy chain, axonemal